MKVKGTRRTNARSQISPRRQVAQLVSGMPLGALDTAIEPHHGLIQEIPVKVALLKPAALFATISLISGERQA
jgi:hypothetical protein